jgi:hypothetical protein
MLIAFRQGSIAGQNIVMLWPGTGPSGAPDDKIGLSIDVPVGICRGDDGGLALHGTFHNLGCPELDQRFAAPGSPVGTPDVARNRTRTCPRPGLARKQNFSRRGIFDAMTFAVRHES